MRILAALVALIAVAGCFSGPGEIVDTGKTMGTTFSIKVNTAGISTDAAHKALAAAAEAIQDVDRKMSTYKKDSELSRFNQQQDTQPFVFSRETFEVLTMSEQVSRESGGAFDITVGPLVNAWGFGPDKAQERELTDEEIAALRPRIGYEKLHLDAAQLSARKEVPDLYCDLSAIAAGYAADRAAEVLDAHGCMNYLVELSGEIRARGVNAQGNPWRIAVEKPEPGERAVERVIPLRDASLATSGDYRNYFEVGGRRLSHEIDPATGRPITHALASATVIHKQCAMADAYATAIMVLGPEKGYEFAVRLNLPVLLIIHDDTAPGGFIERATPAFAQL